MGSISLGFTDMCRERKIQPRKKLGGKTKEKRNKKNCSHQANLKVSGSAKERARKLSGLYGAMGVGLLPPEDELAT